MAILNQSNQYASGDSVTASNLNALIGQATFKTGNGEAVDGSTLQVHSTDGYIMVKDGGISSTKLAAGAVNASAIGSGAITATQLATDSVTATQLANDAVTTSKIKDSTGASDGVTTAKLATGAVTTAKLADGAVTAAKISATDTDFNINATTGHVGMGVLADTGNADNVLIVSGGTAQFQDNAPGGTQAIYIKNTSSTGDSAILQLTARTGGLGYTKSMNIDLSAGQNYLQMVHNDGDQIGVRLDNSNGGSGAETGAFYPTSNNKTSLGKGALKWSVVYAGTGMINTSDRNLKEEIQELSEAELRVAQACKGLVRRFKFKGGTRKHIGVIAQDVRDAFSAEELDAHEYGLFCSDTWTDEDTGEEVTQLGIRYEELLAFIIAAL